MIPFSVAADQNLDSADGLQKALKKLQLASGVFSHLKEIVVSHMQTDPTPDLEPETLGVLSGKRSFILNESIHPLQNLRKE